MSEFTEIKEHLATIIANQCNQKEDITEIKNDVKSLSAWRAATDERLSNGNRRFEFLEKRKIPTGLIIAVITIGFALLGVLIKA